jgi:nucleotidyltransferase/DNA polymerase involved in DNA repair
MPFHGSLYLQYLDAFFVCAGQAFNPKSKGKPVIVGGDPAGRDIFASASNKARPFGIHAGAAMLAHEKITSLRSYKTLSCLKLPLLFGWI